MEKEFNRSHQSGGVFSSFLSALLSGVTEASDGRRLSVHGKTLHAPALGRHGWRWFYPEGWMSCAPAQDVI